MVFLVHGDPDEKRATDPFSQNMTNLRNFAEVLTECDFQIISDQ